MNSETNIFGEIALSLSGGGYRAATFHLGTLTMLHELGLLIEVKVLSTVSGGSIIGAAYTASLADHLEFDEFKERFYAFLESKNVVLLALENLRKSSSINGGSVMPSLIRAAAEVYNSPSLLNGKTIQAISINRGHLDEIIINATEFRSGGSFRFVSSSNPNIRSGNNNAEIARKEGEKIRLADAVAASSCFPSGFEPIRFPSDFVWPVNDSLDKIRGSLGERFSQDIPLMDGGIFDNQGIDSIRNVYDRRDSSIGLYIISDTSTRDSKAFSFPTKPKKGLLPLWLWRLIAALLLLISLASAVAIIVDATPYFLSGRIEPLRGIFLYLVPLIFSISVFGLLIYLFIKVPTLLQLVNEKTGIGLWKYIKRLTIPEVMELVMSRLNSVIEMATNVFMTRVRSLGYNSIFTDQRMTETLVPNIIYDIDNESRWGKEIRTAKLEPKAHLRAVATKAESYATNLWFLDVSELDNLIECGRATICFKLLKYLLRYKTQAITVVNSPEQQLYQKVLDTWKKMNI